MDRPAVPAEPSGRARADADQVLKLFFDLPFLGMALSAPTSRRFIHVNDRLCEMLGYGRDELLAKTWAELLHPDDLAARVLHHERLLAGEVDGFRLESRYRRRDGRFIVGLADVKAARGADGGVELVVAMLQDVTEQKAAQEQVARLVHFDPLTDLPNRTLLELRLDHAIERAQRHGLRVPVLFVDLVGVKTVNDSLGHAAGDALLVAVAARLRARVRDEDTVGRFGGDEFLLVLEPTADAEQAATVARDLLAMLAEPVALAPGREAFVGGSVGISVFPDDGQTTAELLRNADAALWQAKAQGRNRFCFYTAGMNAAAIGQLELEAALRRALERGEFVLHYQPQVDLASGQVAGAEALLRWRREDGRLEAPGSFIPFAEKSGLIVPIGTWVLDEGCRQLATWLGAAQPLRLAVNVSGRQFRSGDLAAVVADALRRHGVPASRLELELTESILMEDPEQAVATLKALKAIGVRVSLDDFGTGYSSFSYLRHFPIDALKIDRSFVGELVSEPAAGAIAVSIIELAHRLRLRVVAEGVETAAQLAYLRRHRCDEMQGFHFERPLPAEDFARLRAEGRCLPRAETDDATARTLLLVDDEPGVLAALRRVLRTDGYRLLTAGSGAEALELLARHPVQVILSDQRMPAMTGTDFLGRVKALHPDTVRMVLSGYADLESITAAVNEGAIYKFLSKPWDSARLREHVRDAFLYYEAVVRPRAGRPSSGC